MNRLVIITICLLIALILGMGVLWPKYQGLARLQRDIEIKSADLQSRQQYLDQLNQLSDELKKYKEPLLKIDSAIPSVISPPSLFNFLQKVSAQSGLVLEGVGQITTGSLEEKSEVKTHSVNLSLSGSYSALKSFLSVLEKNARLFEVENISFSSVPEGSPFSFGVRIRVHSY